MKHSSHTFMGRLARDKRGNTIGIMAAALIPMLGLAGSAVDMSRLYVIKVRLQQACDAGVLAGRKFMTGTGTTLDTAADTQSRNFFRNNYQDGWMRTNNTQFTPVKTSAAEVSGTARTRVPMTIMKFFGFGEKSLTVTCQARYDVADTDILFVLDTTGSMACLPADSDTTCSNYVGAAGNNTYTRPSGTGVAGYTGTAFSVPEKANSRIEAVRQAVLSFYNTFDSVKDPSTRVRYGFVTYASSVNAGRAIQEVLPSALVGANSGDTATYQSRHVTNEYQISRTATPTNPAKTQTDCTNTATTTRNPAATGANPYPFDPSSGTATITTQEWNSGTNPKRCETVVKVMGPTYTYEPWAWPVANVVAGGTVTNPTKVRGQTMKWLGCVETPVQNPGATTFSATNPDDDIDPDAFPTGANRWIPHMQDLAYSRNTSSWSNFTRSAASTTNGDNWTSWTGYGGDTTQTNGNDFQEGGFVACGKPVKRIGPMTQSEVNNWVHSADFVPIGGTYHDTGMIWGARLISPTGPWGADTQPLVAGRNLNRVIIFLTDGDMSPTTSSYSMYGLEGYDKRVTGSNTANTLTDLHNRRFLAACASARAHNIDIWTIAIDTAAQPTLTSCASNASQSKFTSSGTDLGDIFEDIARRLAMLRLTV